MTPEEHRRRLDAVVASEWRLLGWAVAIVIVGMLAVLL